VTGQILCGELLVKIPGGERIKIEYFIGFADVDVSLTAFTRAERQYRR